MAHFRNCIDINIHYGPSCDRYYVIIVYYTVAFLSYLETALVFAVLHQDRRRFLPGGKRVDVAVVGQSAFTLIALGVIIVII